MDSCNRRGACIPGIQFFSGEGRGVSKVDYGFWLSAVLVPIIVILGQASIRAVKHAPQSSSTDVFSFLVILDSAIFVERQRLLSSSSAGSYENLLYFVYVSTILSLMGWAFTQFLLEEKLVARHSRRVIRGLVAENSFSERTKGVILKNYSDEETLQSRLLFAFLWIMAWGISLTLFVMHVQLLAGRHLPWL